MQKWKHAALKAYYWGSQPARWLLRRRLESVGRWPVVVLFYHRVADEHPNDWTLAPQMFARQVRWLQHNTDLISLAEAQHRIRTGSNHRLAVCLTFDDGYAENNRFALPLLIREQIPCTYFVSVGHIQHQQPFPHDVAAGRPLAPNTLAELRELATSGIEIGLHTRHHSDLGRITDPDVLYDEVVGSGADLANLVDQPIRYFAFPFGLPTNLNRNAFTLAREAGYLGVCSAYGGYNVPGDDPFHLQRIHADPEWMRWLNWMTLDPRKFAGIERFDYREPCESVDTDAVCAPAEVTPSAGPTS